MSTENLYPKIPEYVPVENVSEKYNKNLSDARIKEIQAKRHELEMNLKHYKKILKRWKKFGNILKWTSIIIVVGCSVTTIVLSFGAFSTPLIMGIMTAIGGGEGILSEALVLGVIKKKKELFRKKIDYIQQYISKSWFIFEKIRGDGIITLQELGEFSKVMDEYEKGLSMGYDSMDKEYLKLRESLRQQAEKEVKIELKEGLKKELKEELKSKYTVK
jgi:tetratricopeptide (TPR) repeat protein